MTDDFFPEAEETIEDAQPGKGVNVKDDIQADTMIEKVKELRREKERFETIYQGKKAMLDAQFGGKIDSLGKQEEYYTKALEDYFNSLPESTFKESKSSKSYKLLSGTLRTKQQNPEFSFDDSVVTDWLEKHGGEKYVKVTKSINKTELKKAIIIDGDNVVFADNHEVVPGAAITKRANKFIVE
ncbi:MAG TPA: host-nuclease inhibitor Gam family protein [Pseudoneobacillus sp.]|nr:host-nuclease inhibitor Gam family protein [Pseudoneobacillus sp.]